MPCRSRVTSCIPGGAGVRAVRSGTGDLAFRETVIESSRYVDFDLAMDGGARVTVELR